MMEVMDSMTARVLMAHTRFDNICLPAMLHHDVHDMLTNWMTAVVPWNMVVTTITAAALGEMLNADCVSTWIGGSVSPT